MAREIKKSLILLLTLTIFACSVFGCKQEYYEENISSEVSNNETVSKPDLEASNEIKEIVSDHESSQETSIHEPSSEVTSTQSRIESSSNTSQSTVSEILSKPAESSINIDDITPVSRIAVFGDSITAGFGCNTPYIVDIYHIYGIEMLNYAVSGSGYVWNVAYGRSVVVGQGNVQKGINQEINYDTNFVSMIYEKALSLPEKVIMISGGTNDFAYGQNIYDFETAVRSCINLLKENGKIPIIVSPTKRELKINPLGLTLNDYVNTLKRVCDELDVAYIDIYNIGLEPNDPSNKAYYYFETNENKLALHPNDRGQLLIAESIFKQMKSIGIVQ